MHCFDRGFLKNTESNTYYLILKVDFINCVMILVLLLSLIPKYCQELLLILSETLQTFISLSSFKEPISLLNSISKYSKDIFTISFGWKMNIDDYTFSFCNIYHFLLSMITLWCKCLTHLMLSSLTFFANKMYSKQQVYW